MAKTNKSLWRNIIRGILRGGIGWLVKLLTRSEISGLERFPTDGPLIVVANHSGAMEVVLMGIFAPKPMEFFAAMEMPWNDWMGKIVKLYGIIPVYRGYVRPSTLKSGLDVLSDGAILGIFPEGGFWEPGNKQGRAGAAWLSYKSGVSVLPIGFGDTRGLMSDAFQFKFPRIKMNVGEIMAPVELDDSLPKRISLERSAEEIMAAVWDLVPEEEKRRKERQPKNEIFSLNIKILDEQGISLDIPDELAISEGGWISRFIHRTNMIDMIRDYVFPEIQVLKELNQKPSVESIHQAVRMMLVYVNQENPQYFIFRYGMEEGMAFQNSFEQFLELLSWVMDNEYQVEIEAHYSFTDSESGEIHFLTVPDANLHW